MTDRASAAAPQGRAYARHPALAQSVLTVAAVAIASAALVWAALFYKATQQHVTAHVAAASRATHAAPAAGTRQPAPALAPVTTRTS
jgi:hypothetical protein